MGTNCKPMPNNAGMNLQQLGQTQNQMGNMANMFQESLKQALSGHDQQMSTQFAEIKELLAGKAVTSPLPKRAKNQPKEQDDSSL